MRPLSLLSVLGAIIGLAWGLAVGGAVSAVAQSQPSPPALSTEQQLDQCRRTVIELRKANAQASFQAATLEEALMNAQKPAEHPEPKAKAAEKK